MNTKKALLVAGAVGLISFIPHTAKAQSIFNGIRGPTHFQYDNRTSILEKESQRGEKSSITANNFIVKYWSGKNKGMFAFANIPYKNSSSQTAKSTGLGDMSLGVGPRFTHETKYGDFHHLTYLGLTLPTGDTLGTGRTDFKAGVLGTFLTSSKKFEVDYALHYTRSDNSEISTIINGGIVIGGKVSDTLRLTTGPIFNYKPNGRNQSDVTLSWRANLRYTPKGDLGKKFHIEAWYDRSFLHRGNTSPEEQNLFTLAARFSF